MSSVPTPFLKWLGGKRSLAPRIVGALPEEFGGYWEPFLGGGAVFFEVGPRGGQPAMLSDVNADLIGCWKAVRESPDDVVAALDRHAALHSEAHYYEVRESECGDPVEAAARTIYLNKSCYNGLYRMNSEGRLNMAWGGYPSSVICDAANLRSVSAALAEADLRCSGFEAVEPQAGDAVYCDPPYDSAFSGYHSGKFSDDDQCRLRSAAERWADGGASVVVSNSDTDFIRDLWKGWRQVEVRATRSISVDPSKRGAVGELLIIAPDVRSRQPDDVKLPLATQEAAV